jgi:hypothetical protein
MTISVTVGWVCRVRDKLNQNLDHGRYGHSEWVVYGLWRVLTADGVGLTGRML